MDKAKLAGIPEAPGVYIFKDKTGRILYIGKARSLKKRVKSYFTRPQSLKIQIMVSKVADLQYLTAKSEARARLQEARLIRENLPPYNTAFRDDKSFPFIFISKEAFPAVGLTRRTGRKNKIAGSSYFGPYTNAGLLRQALKSVRRIFGFRSCSKMPKRPCLYYRLQLCPAPCFGKISARKYNQIIRNIILFLEGKQEDLLNKLTAKMHKLASKKRFEQAAQVRNQVQALSNMLQEGVPSLFEPHRESVQLKQALGLKGPAQRIEAFDVSNISGSSACASMVYFYNGVPDKKNYRRFRIKGVSGIDDYKMLKEAVGRRYRRLTEEQRPLPDLVIIDGGKGQLNVVENTLRQLRVKLAVISIAKQKEEIFTIDRKAPLRLKPHSPALHLIQRIRDEAHRFALSYHHLLRRKKIIGR
ncbi:UvrB/UvrC motif-containing protein [Candidatus Omnitrophota bacterium]